VGGDEQALSDCTIGQAFGDELGDGTLALGQAIPPCQCARTVAAGAAPRAENSKAGVCARRVPVGLIVSL
jgi:hypothetical protein